MKTGEMKYAQRRALNIFDKWVDTTGAVPRATGYYYELESIIEDAVEIGVQEALKQPRKLDSEED